MPEKTKNGITAVRDVPAWVWISIILLAVATYFAGLNMALLGPDEPRYSQVAREMYLRGDLITPTLGGYHWFEKPALLYWLQIASYNVFGVGEFAARFGSALFGLGTAGSIWFLGNSADTRSNGSIGLGKVLALVASSTIGIIVFSHGASFDIIVTFPMTAALVCFFIYDAGKGEKSLWVLVLFYAFIGLSLLAKGLIGVVFPVAIVAFYHLIAWKMPKPTLIFSLAWGLMFSIGIAATWYFPMFSRHGWEFIDEFFLQHHFQRFTSNKYQHPQPFYFFLWVLPLMTIPWLPFLAAAVVKQVRAFFVVDHNGPFNNLLRFSWAWLIVPLVFFSISGSKLPGYILPAIPPAIVIAGLYIHRLVSSSLRWRNAVLGLAAATFLVMIGAAFSIAPRLANEDSVKHLIEAADAKGHAAKPVLMFLRITHNAEFYAAGRLVRDADGKLHRIANKDDLLLELAKFGGASVVLVPREYTSQLTEAVEIKTEIIANNEEFNIAVVSSIPSPRPLF